jgi:hypothetical protein
MRNELRDLINIYDKEQLLQMQWSTTGLARNIKIATTLPRCIYFELGAVVALGLALSNEVGFPYEKFSFIILKP